MQTVSSPRLRCYPCIYEWTPPHSPVMTCPRCKSRYFNGPKIRPLVLGTGLGFNNMILRHLDAIRRTAKGHGVSLRVFGSIRRGEGSPDSDVDFLVTWPRKNASPLDKAALGIDLQKVVGRSVDLVSEGALHWAIAPKVEAEAPQL